LRDARLWRNAARAKTYVAKEDFETLTSRAYIQPSLISAPQGFLVLRRVGMTNHFLQHEIFGRFAQPRIVASHDRYSSIDTRNGLIDVYSSIDTRGWL
jgi:hypothetical protein